VEVAAVGGAAQALDDGSVVEGAHALLEVRTETVILRPQPKDPYPQ
jgi:hypothetical protein